jgi:hypothetical protein
VPNLGNFSACQRVARAIYMGWARRAASWARNGQPAIDWPFIDAVVRARGVPLEGSLGDKAMEVQVALGPDGTALGARIVGTVPANAIR